MPIAREGAEWLRKNDPGKMECGAQGFRDLPGPGRSVFRGLRSISVELPFSRSMSRLEPYTNIMNVIQKSPSRESRELLLKEYFLNAYLIAMLKQVGDEVGRFAARREPEMVLAEVRTR